MTDPRQPAIAAIVREAMRRTYYLSITQANDYADNCSVRILAMTGGGVGHASDCAVHNAPAMEPGPCDCGAAVGGVGEGWVMVPSEVTDEMIDAYERRRYWVQTKEPHRPSWRAAYRAMLRAAPGRTP